ncbi:McrC family protein [Xanthomonas sp. NCPPB 1067]|uniref:McrC family protein n=1 Tax=Xanthomonas TaxID=338 RepID=UPI001E567BB5|nr:MULTISPECIES: McrC family protein [Xanthomonas]MCC4585942.1 McrC family protein [Xanthomonas sp. NCPPB 1067]MCD0246544.1 McrC family protein [Xanthomonas melonis]
MTPLITVREHARLTTADVASSEMLAQVSQTAFDWLLAESSRLQGPGSGARLVELESRRELRLDSYVGVLESPCGTRVEILPKAMENGESIELGRGLLQKMLARCLSLTPRQSSPTLLRTFDAPLTEWVARQFLLGVDHLVKRGLRFDYHPVQEELRYLRGRLLVARQLRQPAGRAHVFQVEHDVFDADRAENRLIRSALEVVRKNTREPSNWRLAHELAHHLHEIPQSSNVAVDFQRWHHDRLMVHYKPVRSWCSLILHEQMPLAVVGTLNGLSLLFPMEKVYEQYVGQGLRQWLPAGAELTPQAARHYLAQHRGQHWFQLRPDFLIEYDGQRVVVDAKWKLLDGALDNGEQKYGLSQADFYQLYAYGQKYLAGTGTLYLFYPKTSRFSALLPPFHFTEQLKLLVVPFDLERERPIVGFLANTSSGFELR